MSPIDADLAPIVDALEVAFAQARVDARDPNAPEPPRILHPMLGFAHLPDRALARVRDALEVDAAFRERVLSETDAAALSQGARLFLERPDGWRASLQVLVDQERDDAELAARSAEIAELTARLDEVESALEVQRSERAALEERLANMTSEAAVARRGRDAAQARVADLEEELTVRSSAYTESVRQLGEARELAERRLQRVRELEARIEAPSTPPEGPEPFDQEMVAASLADAHEAISSLVQTLGAFETELGLPARNRAQPAPARSGAGRDRKTGGVSTSGAPSRRAPTPGRGLVLDSPEGFAEMLGDDRLLVLVDGYNVSMKGWPAHGIAEQRRSLLSLLADLRARGRADLQVVFDGAFGGERPAVGSPLPVRVHFTEEGVEADDRLLEFVESAGPRRDVVVVSSDRRVRDGAQVRGAGAVSSETLLALRR